MGGGLGDGGWGRVKLSMIYNDEVNISFHANLELEAKKDFINCPDNKICGGEVSKKFAKETW